MATRRNILVLGASGMLGSAVRWALAACREWQVEGTQSEDPRVPDYLDAAGMPPEQQAAILRRRRYEYIVNCIGILKPAIEERDAGSVSRAIRVNALFPHQAALAAPDSRIIHMSTDGVFAATVSRPCLETDPADCPDVYGKTKVLGECPAENVLNLRCSIIGRDPLGGKGLVEWVLRSPEGAELTGFDDQQWNGASTRQFGELCRRIVESESFDRIRRESGVHHFCPNAPTTKYDLLCRIRAASGRKITVLRGRSGAVGSRLLGSVFTSLRELYPEDPGWDAVVGGAVRGEP